MTTKVKARSTPTKTILQQISEIEADLGTAALALRAPGQSEEERARLKDDVIFYFNELVVIERHSRSKILRRTCADVIDRHGFNRSQCPSVEGLNL